MRSLKEILKFGLGVVCFTAALFVLLSLPGLLSDRSSIVPVLSEEGLGQ